MLVSFCVIYLLCANLFLQKCSSDQDIHFDIKNSSDNSFKMTVIVLTMNRPQSLMRLLRSLNKTEFAETSDSFNMEIHVDKTNGPSLHYKECVRIAQNATLPHDGNVTSRIFETNRGLRGAWFESWYPKKDDEFALILEDDLEVSPYWFIWLKTAWKAYANRSDIAGIALSRQFLMLKKPEHNVVIENNFEPFLYKLVGTWGFSPHPVKWRQFLDWFNSIPDSDSFDPYVAGLITSDWLHMHTKMGKRHMTWEQWHIYYSEKYKLFTLYLNLPNQFTLVSHWREAGVHYRQSFNSKDYPTLNYCAIQIQEFPKQLKKFDWDAKEIKTD